MASFARNPLKNSNQMKSFRLIFTIFLINNCLTFALHANSSPFYEVFDDFYDLPQEEQTIENFVLILMPHPSEPLFRLRMSACYIGHHMFSQCFSYGSPIHDWLEGIVNETITIPSVIDYEPADYGEIIDAFNISPTGDDLQLTLGTRRFRECSSD
jgi:hypothetical protein